MFLSRSLDNSLLLVSMTVLATLLFFASAIWIYADRATDSFLPRGNEAFADKVDIQRIYNINDPLLVDISAADGDIFTVEGLELVRRVSRMVQELDGVRFGSVRSLETHDDIISTEDGFDVAPFLDPFPDTEEAARQVRDRVMDFPLYRGLIASEDGKRAGVVADFDQDADVLETFGALNALANEINEETGGKFRLAVTGPPIVTGTLNVYLNVDALRLDPASAALTSALLFLCLRSLAGVFLPLIVMLPSIGAGIAGMSIFGFTFNPFSNAVPVVILATSIADSVHVISRYYDRRIASPNGDRRAALAETIDELRAPIVFTSISTSCGFLLLGYFSPMIPVKEFGLTVSFGVMMAMVCSMTVLPAAMHWLRIEPTDRYRRIYGAKTDGSDQGVWQGSWIDRLARVFLGNRAIIAGFLLVIGAALLTGIPRLVADYEPAKFFPASSAVYKDYYTVSEHYVGANFVEIDIDTGTENGVYEPDLLNRISAFQSAIEAWGFVGNTIAITDYIKKMHQSYNEDRGELYAIPDDANLNAQYFLLYNISGDPRRFDELTDERRTRANLRIFMKTGRYHLNSEFMHWLEAELGARFPAEQTRIGGEAYVVFTWMDTIFIQVLASILTTVFCMFVLGALFLRSLVAAGLLVAPVAMGVGLTYAYIGLTGTPVGLGTSIFASIAIGVGVDFAIHYLWAYRRARLAGESHDHAGARVVNGIGKAILFNALIVAGGFSILLLSKTTPPQQVGTFVAISIAASLATTFLLLSVGTRAWRVSTEA